MRIMPIPLSPPALISSGVRNTVLPNATKIDPKRIFIYYSLNGSGDKVASILMSKGFLNLAIFFCLLL